MPCRQNFFYGKNASSPSKINGLMDFYANFNPQFLYLIIRIILVKQNMLLRKKKLLHHYTYAVSVYEKIS